MRATGDRPVSRTWLGLRLRALYVFFRDPEAFGLELGEDQGERVVGHGRHSICGFDRLVTPPMRAVPEVCHKIGMFTKQAAYLTMLIFAETSQKPAFCRHFLAVTAPHLKPGSGSKAKREEWFNILIVLLFSNDFQPWRLGLCRVCAKHTFGNGVQLFGMGIPFK